jgi:hypothetical protein
VPTTEPAAFAPITDDARAGMNPQLEPLEVFRCARPRGSRVWASKVTAARWGLFLTCKRRGIAGSITTATAGSTGQSWFAC